MILIHQALFNSNIVAVRWGLSGLILALYIFFIVVWYTVKKLSPDEEI